jgi:hypothetical protein
MTDKFEKRQFEADVRARAAILGHDLGKFTSTRIFVNFWTAYCRRCGHASATYAIGDPAGTVRGPALIQACQGAQSTF